MICVFDSNVWISGFHFGGLPLQALDHAFQKHRIAVCAPILHEVRTILSERFNWSQLQIEDILSEYLANAIQVETSGRLRGLSRDPGDDMVLECAVVANASVIVSGDKDLLAVGEYEGIRILSPRAFLDEFVAPSEN